MSEKVVLDTDVASLLFRGDSRATPYRHFVVGRELVISFMTVAELHRWTLKSEWGFERRRRFEYFLSTLAICDSNRQLAELWAEVTEVGRKAGRPINCADAWIAATALDLECPLVTHNAKDYRMIPDLQILTALPE